ncbi:MAG: FAD:protein FMN transferase [Candidatus Methylacidiphilales bacterium]
MATIFELRLVHDDAELAAQAAQAVFATAHQIEAQLSRFIETSDVSRIRTLQPGQSLRLHAHTAACLHIALEMMQRTGGAFDPTLGAQMDRLRNTSDDSRPLLLLAQSPQQPSQSPESQAPRATLSLDPDTLTLYCDGPAYAEPVHLDLGAIGKGYALDVMAEELQDWDITRALLLAGGSSSILALGGPACAAAAEDGDNRRGEAESEGWCISLSSKQLLFLENAAISTSGTSVKGAHILDPRTGRPAVGTPVRTWAVAPTAAQSDALSTSWMLLSTNEMQSLCNEMPGVAAVLEISDAPGTVEPLTFITGTSSSTGHADSGMPAGAVIAEYSPSQGSGMGHLDNPFVINMLT